MCIIYHPSIIRWIELVPQRSKIHPILPWRLCIYVSSCADLHLHDHLNRAACRGLFVQIPRRQTLRVWFECGIHSIVIPRRIPQFKWQTPDLHSAHKSDDHCIVSFISTIKHSFAYAPNTRQTLLGQVKWQRTFEAMENHLANIPSTYQFTANAKSNGIGRM